MAQRQPAPERQDPNLAHYRDRAEQRLEPGLVAHGPHARPVEDPCALDEVIELPVFLAETLDHPDTGHRLLDNGGHLALPLLGLPVGGEGADPHPVGGDDQQGHHHEADRAQQGRVHKHDDQRGHQQQHVARHDGQEGQESLQQADVGVGSRHQLPRLHLVVTGEIKLLQLIEDGVAEIELHIQAHPATAVPAQVRQPEGGRRGHSQDKDPGP